MWGGRQYLRVLLTHTHTHLNKEMKRGTKGFHTSLSYFLFSTFHSLSRLLSLQVMTNPPIRQFPKALLILPPSALVLWCLCSVHFCQKGPLSLSFYFLFYYLSSFSPFIYLIFPQALFSTPQTPSHPDNCFNFVFHCLFLLPVERCPGGVEPAPAVHGVHVHRLCLIILQPQHVDGGMDMEPVT